jgi:hypothetical protein
LQNKKKAYLCTSKFVRKTPEKNVHVHRSSRATTGQRKKKWSISRSQIDLLHVRRTVFLRR